jgi:hypothetical protein
MKSGSFVVQVQVVSSLSSLACSRRRQQKPHKQERRCSKKVVATTTTALLFLLLLFRSPQSTFATRHISPPAVEAATQKFEISFLPRVVVCTIRNIPFFSREKVLVVVSTKSGIGYQLAFIDVRLLTPEIKLSAVMKKIQNMAAVLIVKLRGAT